MFSINLSKARRGKRYNKSRIKVNVTPQIHTVKTRLKMSERARGVSVKIFDKPNNLVNEFPTIRSAAKHFGVDVKTISNIFRTGISYDDYVYKFEAKDLRVWVYNSNNNLINVLNNMTKASLLYKILPTTMYRYIKSGKLYKNLYYFCVK